MRVLWPNSVFSGGDGLEAIEERWRESHRMLVDRGGMTEAHLMQSLSTSIVELRDGFLELMDSLTRNRVEVLITSCGFRNIIVDTLSRAGAVIDEISVSVDAHTLEFDSNSGALVEVNPEKPLHHQSKRFLHERHPMLCTVEGHFHAVVVGDSEGDFQILRDHTNCTVLRIGFALDDSKAAMMIEMEWCDLAIICDDNAGFGVVTKILDRIGVLSSL